MHPTNSCSNQELSYVTQPRTLFDPNYENASIINSTRGVSVPDFRQRWRLKIAMPVATSAR
jgi:hypothetical protein